VQKELGRFAGADGFELARRGGEIEEARQSFLARASAKLSAPSETPKLNSMKRRCYRNRAAHC
jgi:hypothetical protein